jgi:hypothetical protein
MMFEFEGHDVLDIQRRFRSAREAKDYAGVVHSAVWVLLDVLNWQ